MFFLIQLNREIKLHPKHFGPRLYETLVSKLQEEVEGTCTGRYGYIVTTMAPTPDQIGNGLISPETGFAHFEIKFKAIVCRPFKGEVADAIVTTINKMGIFAEIGPLQVFVSSKLMPEGMTFSADGAPCYTNEQGSVTITKGMAVRLRIIGTRVDTSEIFSIGSIKDRYLGVIERQN